MHWRLLKRQENLTEKEEIKLITVLQYNPKSIKAYLLKEGFQMLWENTSPIGLENISTNGVRE